MAERVSDGHYVCMSYAVSGLNVDIVPVQNCGDADDRGNLFPREGGEPVLTSIPFHLKFIRVRKDRYKDPLRQVIRLVKWWVRQQRGKDNSFRMQSFMIEFLVAHLADSGVALSD